MTGVVRGVAALAVALVLVVAATVGAFAALLGPTPSPTGPTGGPGGSAAGNADIPVPYRALYESAARGCPGLHWSVLAAVGKVESDHGRANLPGVRSGANHAGARGPMQFVPATFAAVTRAHPPPPGGAVPPSPYDPHDAVHTAAAYLCDHGARHHHDLPAAIFTYNHSRAYVTRVLDLARRYAATAPGASGAPTTAPSGAARTALVFALAHLGQPYLWGGDGPAAGEAGFDCSGLTTAAYHAAGITLPRTAHTQFQAGPRLAPGSPLAPGDLVFFGPATKISHVGLYLGDGTIVHAPRRGQPVQTTPLTAMSRPTGATRPTAGPTTADPRPSG